MSSGKRQLQHSPIEKSVEHNAKKFQNMNSNAGGDTFSWEGLQKI